MADEIRELIFQLIDQRISAEDFERLQDAIEADPDVRDEYLRAINLCESLADDSVDSLLTPNSSINESSRAGRLVGVARGDRWTSPMIQWALAAAVVVLVGCTAYWLGQKDQSRDQRQIAAEDQDAGRRGSENQFAGQTEATQESTVPDLTSDQTESRLAGHATLRRAVDLKWANQSTARREGDVLPNGPLVFDEGVAEIDFFCGATLIVDGPAHLEIESDWSVRVAKGRLRANVPPAARGFIVKAADSEIVDLGTEFALEVDSDNARVEVIDGEVELRGGEHDGKHLLTGEGQSLRGTQGGSNLTEGLSTVSDVRRRRQAAEAKQFEIWKGHSDRMRTEDRLIAYYPIAASQSGRLVQNVSRRGRELDGQLVGPVGVASGRFGDESTALEFDRLGSRVRTRIDGEFDAFTFACWARIDSLEHRYNALFMADSYQNGEPHWQIRDDGKLMFSVMVDDTQEIKHFSELDQRIVSQAGLHRVYFTEPFWDISKSGQWFHLAAVYDPAGRHVTQYVNGRQIASEEIIDKFYIDTLRIGASEIGNWGQPFRKSPWFAVRNLNGAIDELAIFDAALQPQEIESLYQQGKPLGY